MYWYKWVHVAFWQLWKKTVVHTCICPHWLEWSHLIASHLREHAFPLLERSLNYLVYIIDHLWQGVIWVSQYVKHGPPSRRMPGEDGWRFAAGLSPCEDAVVSVSWQWKPSLHFPLLQGMNWHLVTQDVQYLEAVNVLNQHLTIL
jgi:hypothetical protein